jgi:hypothetical protein
LEQVVLALLVTALELLAVHPLLAHFAPLLVVVAAEALVIVGLVALEPQAQEAVALLIFLGQQEMLVVLAKLIAEAEAAQALQHHQLSQRKPVAA